MIENIRKALKKIFAAILVAGFFGASAYAVDRYVVTAPAGIMAGDSTVTFTVTPMEGAAVDLTPHRVRFLNLPSGVSVDPNDIINGVTIAGQTVFTLYVNQNALAGSFNLRVERSNDPGVYGQQSVTVYRTVNQFTIEPPVVPFTGKAGEAFMLRVTARDVNGAVVGAFMDDVDLAADIGDILVSGSGTVLWGSSFNNGVALVPVVLYGTTIGSLANNITATARKLYPGQSVRASGRISQDITIEPNVFHHVMLLFPGETINPGRTSGKVGAANNATSGVPVSNVTVYLCDQYHNPIRTDRNQEPGLYPVEVSFSSNRVGDTVATPKTFTDINSVNINNEFIFVTSGQTHEITAQENRNSTTDSSSIYVQSASASIFEITPVADPQSAVSPFALTIIARDFNGNIDVSYNRTVSVIGLWGTGNALGENTVDTNPATPQADNSITFVNGQWTGSIKVTRAHSSVYLRFDDNNGQVGETNPFRVVAGQLSRLWITLPGEVFTEGAWPGNALGVSPNTFTAGDIISIQVRAVDASWNQVAVPVGQQITIVSPNGVIDAPVGVLMDAVGDKVVSGIQLRTAGQAQLLAASIPLTPLTNSNPFVVNPKLYNRLVLAAPGEQLVPGIFPADQPDGKIGTPSNQVISEDFYVTVHAVDEYFNPINAGPYPVINFTSTDPGAFLSGGSMGNASWPYNITMNTLGVQQLGVSDGSKNDSVAIEVVPGPVQRYEISNITSPKDVNVPFNITINARDAFDNITPVNNTLNLTLSVGPNSLLPQTVTLVNGVWSGTVTSYGSGLNLTVNAVDQQAVPVTGVSNQFNVRSGSYSKLLLLLNGETYTQGIAPGTGVNGKFGTPTPTTVGDAVAATVIACDEYFNPVGGVYPTVQLASDHIVNFAQNPITINTFDGVFLTSLVLRDAADHTITLRDVNNDGIITRSTSTVTGLAASFSKLLLLAPGQANAPGTAIGRSGTAIVQTAGIPFDVTVYAVDQFWNRVTTVNSESIVIGSSDGSIAMNPPFNQGYAFNNGEIIFTVHLGSEGSIKVSAADTADATKAFSETDIIVAPGASYRIIAPDTVNAGQEFALTVQLIDSATQLPGSFNHSFNMSAVLINGTPATGALNLNNAVLNNGVITIPNQSYDYVESIKIKITDQFSRVQYSDAINVVPNGLYYDIATPVNAVAGPPSTFKIKVELKEQITGTPVKTMDHRIGIEIISAATGIEGEGIYDVKETNLLQGISEFDMSYTKAENIFIRIWDRNNTTGYSPTRTSAIVRVVPDTYKKLQIVCPGETTRPGIPSPTGKDSSGIIQQKQAVPFVVSVMAVDQYWNLVTYNGGSVRLSSEDGSLGASNPLNQGSAFVNGIVNFSISLFSAGNIKVTCQDSADLGKEFQQVYIPVSGAYYEVQAPTETYSGPPSSFSMALILKDSETGSIIPANHRIYLTPMTPAKQPVELGVLGVTEASLVNGIANIPAQTYNVAEDIVIKVNDDFQRVSFGDVIRVVPRQVELRVTAPDIAKVGPPDTFPVSIRLLDVDTGNSVARYNAVFAVEAISAETGMPGTGTLMVRSVELSRGELTFTQAYSRAGGIFIRVSSSDQNAFSNTITMVAGEPVSISVNAPSEIEATQENVFVEARLYDRFNNLISERLINFRFSAMYDGIYLSADQAMTDASGVARVQFVTDPSAREKAVIGAVHGKLSDSKEINIKGAPQTNLFVVSGINTEMSDALHIKENTPVALTAETGGLSLERIMYSVNNGEFRVYNGPFTLPVGTHVVSFYSVSVGAQMHTENIKMSKTIHVSSLVEDKLVNFPNPFKAGSEPTFIEFYTYAPTSVKITIYSVLGQLVWEKDYYFNSAGLQRVEWDGRNSAGFVIANGGYLCITEIRDENRTLKRKIAVRK